VFFEVSLTEDRLANSIPDASVRPFALMTQVILPSRRISSDLCISAMSLSLKRIPERRAICDTAACVFGLCPRCRKVLVATRICWDWGEMESGFNMSETGRVNG
jgi:hypothetical protein